MTTYTKSLARRANLVESSVKATKAYKAKVASLTSEKVLAASSDTKLDRGCYEA